MSVQYSTYTDIVVDGSAEYQGKVLGCLTVIEKSWPSGQAFLAAINGTKKRLTIGPREVGALSNYCAPLTRGNFTLFTQAIIDNNGDAFRSALRAGRPKKFSTSECRKLAACVKLTANRANRDWKSRLARLPKTAPLFS